MPSSLRPTFRYVFRLADGETLLAEPRQARRTVDRRNDAAPTVTVWEVESNGIIRRLWPEDIVSWAQEEVGA